MSDYVHSVPGRLRVRTGPFKKDSRKAIAARDFLLTMQGVTSAAVNTVTGSVTVTYDTEVLTSAAILENLRDHGYVAAPATLPNVTSEQSELGQVVSRKLSQALVGFLLEKALERSVAAALAAVL